MKLDGNKFKNSDTCAGISYVDEDAQIDMAIIDISGRYPESGWAVNEVVHEMVCVKRGMGTLVIKGAQTYNLKEGDAVTIAPGKRFAWNGDMTIIMACNPPFYPEQYNVEDDDEI